MSKEILRLLLFDRRYLIIKMISNEIEYNLNEIQSAKLPEKKKTNTENNFFPFLMNI